MTCKFQNGAFKYLLIISLRLIPISKFSIKMGGLLQVDPSLNFFLVPKFGLSILKRDLQKIANYLHNNDVV